MDLWLDRTFHGISTKGLFKNFSHHFQVASPSEMRRSSLQRPRVSLTLFFRAWKFVFHPVARGNLLNANIEFLIALFAVIVPAAPEAPPGSQV